MAIKNRIETVEKKTKPKREVVFIIKDDRASGRAMWRKNLKWENLTRQEHEQLANRLEADGVKVLTLNVIPASQEVDNAKTD